jgi:phage tail-like protein
MKPVEFRQQIFRDSSHWKHGLSYKLKSLETGGFALFSRPAFAELVIQASDARRVASLVVDRCGRIFWIHQKNCQLYCYDPISRLIEPLVELAECEESRLHSFGRMISVQGRLWILDRSDSRLIALRTDTFQIIAEIPLSDPIDIAWGGNRLFVLDRDGISTYDVNGTNLSPPRSEHLWQPVALGADPCGKWIYVIDRCGRGFRRFTRDGSFHDEIGSFCDVGADFKPTLLAVNSGGNLFVCDGSRVIHEFALDGGNIGGTGEMNPLSGILGMTFSPSGELYVGSPEGIARFESKTGLAGNQGLFYSGTLDSGGDGVNCWHRLDLVADLDVGGNIEVCYASSDNEDLAGTVNSIIAREGPAAERVNDLELQLSDYWKGPEQLQAFSAVEAAEDAASQSSFGERSTHSMLLREDTKRYLWLKLSFSALAPQAKVSVSSMRVSYPRLSYLRYLPAVYQEDPTSREFLGRFLSIFETIFSDLEATIERIPEIFDPESTPKEFLDWLAQWLDLGIEEEWSPNVKRQLIHRAASLYQRKGRPDALAEFIEIVTQKRPFIRESFNVERPFILGATNLSLESRVFHQPTEDLPRDQRTVLGFSSILGTSRINQKTQVPINPFRAAAHHFTLLIDLSPQEFQRYERRLHRIIRENSPAHVGYDIRLVSGAGLGPDMVLGINFRVQDPQPLYLGHSSLGRSILNRFWYGPELGIDAWVAGAASGSNDAASSYGEQ